MTKISKGTVDNWIKSKKQELGKLTISPESHTTKKTKTEPVHHDLPGYPRPKIEEKKKLYTI